MRSEQSAPVQPKWHRHVPPRQLPRPWQPEGQTAAGLTPPQACACVGHSIVPVNPSGARTVPPPAGQCTAAAPASSTLNCGAVALQRKAKQRDAEAHADTPDFTSAFVAKQRLPSPRVSPYSPSSPAAAAAALRQLLPPPPPPPSEAEPSVTSASSPSPNVGQ